MDYEKHPLFGVSDIPQDIRDLLLDVVGVDVWYLANLQSPSPLPKSRVWRIHGMRCKVIADYYPGLYCWKV